MDVDELLSRAWSAVQASGVPEPLQAVAFREAVAFLRGDPADEGTPEVEQKKPAGAKRPPRTAAKVMPDQGGGTPPSEQEFFDRLVRESGSTEADLRDILQLTSDSKVHITQPTRSLGASIAEQARTVIALIAGARAIGLGENPVSADAVRQELIRKRCYQQNNFSTTHLGRLKGFNSGATRSQIVLTSKWADEFDAAVSRAHGRVPEE